jgi:hypothetical protein
MFSLTTQSIARINSQTLSSSSTKKVNAPSRARQAFLKALVEPSSSIDDAEILEKSLDAPAASKEIPRPRKAMIDPADGTFDRSPSLFSLFVRDRDRSIGNIASVARTFQRHFFCPFFLMT